MDHLGLDLFSGLPCTHLPPYLLSSSFTLALTLKSYDIESSWPSQKSTRQHFDQVRADNNHSQQQKLAVSRVTHQYG